MCLSCLAVAVRSTRKSAPATRRHKRRERKREGKRREEKIEDSNTLTGTPPHPTPSHPVMSASSPPDLPFSFHWPSPSAPRPRLPRHLPPIATEKTKQKKTNKTENTTQTQARTQRHLILHLLFRAAVLLFIFCFYYLVRHVLPALFFDWLPGPWRLLGQAARRVKEEWIDKQGIT